MKGNAWTFCIAALAVALGMAALSPLASSRPDGLEKVTADQGRVKNTPPGAPMADYQAPGVKGVSLRTILAGLAGTLAVFAVTLILGKLVAARQKPARPEGIPGATPPPR